MLNIKKSKNVERNNSYLSSNRNHGDNSNLCSLRRQGKSSPSRGYIKAGPSGVGFLRVPGMHCCLWGESPHSNLVEVKDSKTQGHHREVLSEGSVEQTCELTDRNLINRRQGWASWRETAKPVSTKNRKRKSGSCAGKAARLTPGGLRWCSKFGTSEIERFHILAQKSAEGIVVRFLRMKAQPM